MQIRRFRGRRTVMSFRLCSRAPWTTSSSAAAMSGHSTQPNRRSVQPGLRPASDARPVKLTLATVVLALALAPAASASSSLPRAVHAAASRAGFSGEVAVERHGRLVFAHGFGLANRARGLRVTLATAFDLASLGKMFTGLAAAQLVEAGKLRVGPRRLLRRSRLRASPADADDAGRLPAARDGRAAAVQAGDALVL